ncbi:hypothetical protein [Planomicrobium okeanokoites]|uniref:Uncharacterized protein n=1 Tax=Planomicrobium okeanokoites TaxID=244 RepID=A0ABV7KTA9_PLAOK|nr:hypothetical protein [Planomicrobium okeanokoites]TAA65582.1 hypothetical protein D2910_16550 [Planomicrobium okeanokoites]
MTYFYYIASDIELTPETYKEHQLYFERSNERIKGFDFPVQIEIDNGINTKKDVEVLLKYIYEKADNHKRCTFQIAKLVNSNRVPFKVLEKNQVLLHKIKSSEELLLPEGHLLTIKKVPVVY